MSPSLGKCPTPGGRKGSPMGPDHRVLVKCLVQLLALRPHCEHELLERLDRVQICPRDRAQLLPVLEEVGQLSPRESSYRLKKELFGQVQEDWLGYTAEEQQQVRQLLRRKQDHGAVARPFLVPLECPSCQGASRRPLGVKRLALLDALDPQGLKKPCAQGHPRSSLGSHHSLQEPGLEHQRAHSQQQPCQLPRPSAELQSSEEELSDGEGGDDWEEGALRLEQHLSALQDSSSRVSPPASFAELPDYCRKYRAICSVEQHHAYMEAFSADYAEYRRLHTRIGTVSRTFMQLGAKIKTLPRGTQEHKAVEDRILQEYRRFKQSPEDASQTKVSSPFTLLPRADAIRSKLIYTFYLIDHLQGLSHAIPRHNIQDFLGLAVLDSLAPLPPCMSSRNRLGRVLCHCSLQTPRNRGS
uniref:OCEL domain-containing protein n=1 Tax=Gopherus agassizii TaxID=38772 RepID=A0A452I4C1_9SAUR